MNPPPSTPEPRPQAGDGHLEATARAVAHLRPNWSTAGILAVLHELDGTLEPRDLHHAAISAAKDQHNRTPGAIRYVARDWIPGDVERRAVSVTCSICGKTEHHCAWDRPRTRNPEDADTHVFTPSRAPGKRPAGLTTKSAATSGVAL